MKLFQINTSVNTGSTGRIAEEIGIAAIEAGYKSYIAAAYSGLPSKSEVIKIGNSFDRYMHGLKTRLLDRHGFGSLIATKNLIKKIEKIGPDIIHLHNIHGYYIHIGVLFDYIKKAGKPVVWTLHDCWPFTGHCAHFERVNCYKWHERCYKCPNRKGYPESWVIDNSEKNYKDKKKIFDGVNNLHLVAPSEWLAKHLKKSFLKNYPVIVINNGIDLSKFRPVNTVKILKKYKLNGKKFILGVANTWKKKRAFEDFLQLSRLIENDLKIVLVGLENRLISKLPDNVIGINRTENIDELAALYSAAGVFVNPTYADNFPSTNLEALACGTPVITYNTGGSPEVIDENTGIVVEKGDINGIRNAISEITTSTVKYSSQVCRSRAEKFFSSKEKYSEYLSLYEKILSHSNL